MTELVDSLNAELSAHGGYLGRSTAVAQPDAGKLSARDRVERLVDANAYLLELSPLAAFDTDYPAGAGVITALGVVEDVECIIIANDYGVRGGAWNPFTVRKMLRAQEIARENRLPLINLVESAGADLRAQSEILIPGGELFRNLTRLSAAGIPVISVVFGSSTAGGAYLPGLSDYVVMVRNQARVYLGGPPLVKMATGEESDHEDLGGAEMHSSVSGVSDYLAADDADGIRIGREIIRHLQWRKLGVAPCADVREPVHDADELLGIVPVDLKQQLPSREVIARLCDGSEFEEFKATFGTSMVTGWGSIHGYPVGLLANERGVIFSEEAQKATQFIQLCNQLRKPIVFLQNTTGFIVGKEYEQRGIIKDGAKFINAVSNSRVPHITIMMGAAYGAGIYAMNGRPYHPRFLFTWPNHRTAVMGGPQLAGVFSLIRQRRAASTGDPFDSAADAEERERIEAQIESESSALYSTARIWDDGIIDPRDTRNILGICLSACNSNRVEGISGGYGTFRM